MGRDEDYWMSDGSEFQGSDAATGNVHRPTVVWVGMVEQSVDVMMMSEGGDDRAGWRHEQDHWGTVARDHAAHDMPWWPPWNRLVVVDAANVELQGHLRHGCNDLDETPDELQHWKQTGGATVSMLETWPGQSCHIRVLSAQVTPPGNGSSRKLTKLAEWGKTAWTVVRRTWVAGPRSLSRNTLRSRMALTGQMNAPPTENEQLVSCDSLRVDEHHIPSVSLVLS